MEEKKKSIGTVTISATGLRKMANFIQGSYKTKKDIEADMFIVSYEDGMRTIGIDLKPRT